MRSHIQNVVSRHYRQDINDNFLRQYTDRLKELKNVLPEEIFRINFNIFMTELDEYMNGLRI